ncbi:hypothetical protein LR004_01675 [Candidatus Gracilibacteria bacterium]|nr:hypothetical protein [Candidatus Gracilibacteria bacterium]
MAQLSVREYDVKQMFFSSIDQKYSGIQIKNISDIEKLEQGKIYVIKPDMLFGKRGKRGLIGFKLSKDECAIWLKKYFQKKENIDGVEGTLDVFLVEECITPQKEYYISFAQERGGNRVCYSDVGGVDIEENWDSVQQVLIPISQKILSEEYFTKLGITSTDLQHTITQLWEYYNNFGYVSLECNPVAEDENGNLVILDAVAKIDDYEAFRQKENWKSLEIPNNYGFNENKGERKIRELDATTGASLKMKILNPKAKIWTLLAGGGGSLVMTDTLGALGYSDNIGNYGECSGNPTREFTREYTRVLLSQMLGNNEPGKYLIIAGAIANFTHIDTTFSGIIDAFEERQQDLLDQKVTILVRRGGINEKKGLQILEEACKRLKIPTIITGSDSYMTGILKEIKLRK